MLTKFPGMFKFIYFAIQFTMRGSVTVNNGVKTKHKLWFSSRFNLGHTANSNVSANNVLSEQDSLIGSVQSNCYCSSLFCKGLEWRVTINR